MKRVLIVTAGLALTGAIVGSVLGLLSMGLLVMIRDMRLSTATGVEQLVAGAAFGAVTGAILAPIAALSLMRSAPLWRAVGEPALGTTLGAVIAVLLEPAMEWGLLGPVIGGVTGFVAAAVRLRIAFRGKPARVAIAETE